MVGKKVMVLMVEADWGFVVILVCSGWERRNVYQLAFLEGLCMYLLCRVEEKLLNI